MLVTVCCYRVVHHDCGVVGGSECAGGELQTGAVTGQSSLDARDTRLGGGGCPAPEYIEEMTFHLSAPSSSPLGAGQTLHGVRTLDTQVMIVM